LYKFKGGLSQAINPFVPQAVNSNELYQYIYTCIFSYIHTYLFKYNRVFTHT